MRIMAMVAAMLAMVGPALAPAMAQDPRVPTVEADADRITAQQLYDQQRQRDQQEADRVARENAERQTDYDLYLARQKAEYEAKMAAWRAEVARQQAAHAEQVARCQAGDRNACAPR